MQRRMSRHQFWSGSLEALQVYVTMCDVSMRRNYLKTNETNDVAGVNRNQ